MRASALVKRLVAGTFVAAALLIGAPGLAGAAPVSASHSIKPVVNGFGHIIGAKIGLTHPCGPGWDGQE